MAFARCCKQWAIAFLTLYGWWVEIGVCPVKVGFRSSDDQKPGSFSQGGNGMNISPTYLSHIDVFSEIDPNAISLKYSTYILANTDDNGETVASPCSC